MLPVDRDLDDDRTFEYVVARHDENECPHAFVANDGTRGAAARLRLEAPTLLNP